MTNAPSTEAASPVQKQGIPRLFTRNFLEWVSYYRRRDGSESAGSGQIYGEPHPSGMLCEKTLVTLKQITIHRVMPRKFLQKFQHLPLPVRITDLSCQFLEITVDQMPQGPCDIVRVINLGAVR